MNALVDALISYPGESIVVVSALVLLVILLSMVRVAASWRADRRLRHPGETASDRIERLCGEEGIPVDQTRVMARQFPARPDDMTAVQYVIEPIEGWGGRRG